MCVCVCVKKERQSERDDYIYAETGFDKNLENEGKKKKSKEWPQKENEG